MLDRQKKFKNDVDEFNKAREERIQEEARRAEEERRQKEIAEAKRVEEEKRKEALRLEEERLLKEQAEAERLEEEKRQKEIVEAKRIEEERQKQEAKRLELEEEQKAIADALTREVEKQQMELALEAARLEDKYREQLLRLGNDLQTVEKKMKSLQGLDVDEFEALTNIQKAEGIDDVSLPFYVGAIDENNNDQIENETGGKDKISESTKDCDAPPPFFAS